MDRSTRNLSITTLVVLTIFLALNHISTRANLADWWLVLLLLLLAVGIWFYDRVSHRGIDDSEVVDTVIEPVSYGHISIPDSIQVAGPGVNVVTTAFAEAPAVIEDTAPKAEAVELQAAPTPPSRPDVDNANHPPEAAANLSSAPSVDEIKRDKSEAAQPSPAATTMEEKSAPLTSASAPETHPDLAAKSPGGINAPSVPVSEESADQPVPTSVAGSAPEPIEPANSPDEVPQESVKSTSATSETTVSASEAAASAPNVGDPNLPMRAVTGEPDDLKIIEGIGPKMEKALHAAGINTFAVLAGTSEEQINAAITAAGMRFAPSVPTWAEQASYAANGDFVGLEAYQKTLKGGRKGK